MSRILKRSLITGIAVAVGLTGAAQAAPFNIFSVSQADNAKFESVRHGGPHRHHRHRRGGNGAALAIGAMGAIAAGAAIASQRDRYYYDDDYYYDDGYGYDYAPPQRYYRDCPPRPNNYPTDQC